MEEGDSPDAAGIDLRLDRTEDHEPQVDTATLVAAKTFGAIALPKGISPAKAAFIEASADASQNMAGAEGFISDANGPLNEPTPAERKRQTDEDNLAYLLSIGEEAQEQRRLEREREEWSHTSSTVAGVTMTGAEWAQLAKRLRTDDDLHRRLIETFEARGMTSAEAETRYNRVADVAEIAAIPPGQRTEDQVATFERAKADPAIRRDVEQATSLANQDPALARTSSMEGISTAAQTAEPQPSQPNAQPPVRPVTNVVGPGF